VAQMGTIGVEADTLGLPEPAGRGAPRRDVRSALPGSGQQGPGPKQESQLSSHVTLGPDNAASPLWH